MKTAQFHGFAVDGFALTGIDDSGCRWMVEDAQGWFAGGAVRGTVENRMQQNGDWRTRQYRAGRTVTLRGKVFAPSTTQLELSARRLSAVLRDGGFAEFVGDSPAGALSSMVQLDAEPLFEPLSDLAAAWQLTLGSEDPLLYGPRLFGSTTLASSVPSAGRVWPRAWTRDWGVPAGVTPGAVVVANAGTSSYFPRVQIDGPVTNPVVTVGETGDSLRYRGAVPAGQFLDIDCARRSVLLAARSNPTAGVPVRGRVSFTGGWLAVPIGGATVAWTADSYGDSHRLSVWSYEGAWL